MSVDTLVSRAVMAYERYKAAMIDMDKQSKELRKRVSEEYDAAMKALENYSNVEMESYSMTEKCNCVYGQAGECPESPGDRTSLHSEMDCPSWWEPKDQWQDGDVYLNPFFGDLWVVDGKSFIKINDGYTIDLDEPEGFVKVGHINGVINKRKT